MTRIQVVPLDSIPLTDNTCSSADERRIVLVVDDERVIADTLSIILSKRGFVVLTAYDAISALDLARTIPPDLLLSDVMMGPGMDGTQLALELMKTDLDCKVILFSGHAATQDLLQKAREQGHHFTVLTKPLHPADLLTQIDACFCQAEFAATA